MGSSKSSTQSTTNSNQTVTPINPTWVTGGLAGVGQMLSGLNGLDPYSLVSGADPLQTAAGQTAAGLGADASGDFSQAGTQLAGGLGYTAPAIYDGGGRAPSVLDNLGAYMSPYLGDVVRSSLASYDYNAGQQQAANRLALANDATFGGSGGAIQTALGNQQLAQGRAQLQSGLLNQGYDTALGAATTDAQLRNDARNRAVQASIAQANAQLQAEQMRQAAATGLANVGSAADANARANVGTQASIGDVLRQIQQQQLAAPLSTAATLGGIWGSLPLALLHGENTVGQTTRDSTTTMTPSLMSQIEQGIGIASSLAGRSIMPMSLMSLPTAEPMTLFSGSLTQPTFPFTP